MKTADIKYVGPHARQKADTPTGQWRLLRPVINDDVCISCGQCLKYCPCGVISEKDGRYIIDYRYCKGCGICAEVCPKNAIGMFKEPTEEVRDNAR